MAVTSADIHGITFGKPPFGKRGYDEEQVDAFLDEVQRSLASMESDLAAVRGGGADPGAGSAVLAALQRIEQRLDRIEASAALGAPRLTPPDPLFGGT